MLVSIFTNKKSYTSVRLVLKSVTLNDLKRHYGVISPTSVA